MALKISDSASVFFGAQGIISPNSKNTVGEKVFIGACPSLVLPPNLKTYQLDHDKPKTARIREDKVSIHGPKYTRIRAKLFVFSSLLSFALAAAGTVTGLLPIKVLAAIGGSIASLMLISLVESAKYERYGK